MKIGILSPAQVICKLNANVLVLIIMLHFRIVFMENDEQNTLRFKNIILLIIDL